MFALRRGFWISISVALSMAAIATSCVPVRPIRVEMPVAESRNILAPPELSPKCETGFSETGEKTQVIEEYGNYAIGFVEFDDQGWSYLSDAQLAAVTGRLQADLANPQYSNDDFSVIVFVHGWHHNAHDNDCNVQEMRQMMKLSSEAFDRAYAQKRLMRARRLFGIYVGWRGESVDAAGIRYATIIDRRDAAERVAKGSIRQLMADLHVQASDARETAARDPNQHRKDAIDIEDRMYTTVVGHSFGAAVVFNSLSQDLLDDITIACKSKLPQGEHPFTGWPDEVVLINPAFEASRFEPINRLADQTPDCPKPRRLPLLSVITADTDEWTGWVFTAGRTIITQPERYDRSTPDSYRREREANVDVIGRVDRYQTHRLCLAEVDGQDRVIAYPMPISPSIDEGPNRWVWSLRAPGDIIEGHNGFLYVRTKDLGAQPYLLNWLIDLHIPQSTVMGREDQCKNVSEPLKPSKPASDAL